MAAEINERLLTQDERSELALLRKAARGEATSSEWADAFGPSGSREWVRRHPWTLVAALLYLGFVTFTVVMLVRLQPHWVYTVGVAAFVLILGGLSTRDWQGGIPPLGEEADPDIPPANRVPTASRGSPRPSRHRRRRCRCTDQ